MTTSPDATAELSNPCEAILPRIESTHLLRGVVMVLMVLDRVRDFFGDATIDPTDLSVTTQALFAVLSEPLILRPGNQAGIASASFVTNQETNGRPKINRVGDYHEEPLLVPFCVCTFRSRYHS